ncbi:diglucosylglycerate octanoyltransferase [Gordonia sp. OPL2]|uniref:diglucosylglycerate octanoyltransferase n=1 Tax=Gordonia sp. OPL2 TaxID=2486274 RepID=UPI00165539B3|nr:diglucosylglycerate octanoyltransferase [Gordonia sp. OPL2]RPA12862.1 SGNH/GDSL hydrolase family protein [Gordonia sp. OPL2]
MTAPGPVTRRSAGAGSILVLSDSLAYYGPGGGLPAGDPRIWPTIVGDRCRREVRLFGRIGWTSRDVWWALTQDPNIWAAVPSADVVVLAFGGMDSLPSPLPTALREQIRYVRPNRLRQVVRDGYQWLQPRLSRTGWPTALPPRITVEYLEKIRDALTQLRPELPIVVCLPPTHNSPYYGRVHSGRIPTTAAMMRWADDHDLPTADFYPATRDAFRAPEAAMNPDGIHWGWDCHRAVADVVVSALEPMLPPVVVPAADGHPTTIESTR